jgi:WD40 repeat protein
LERGMRFCETSPDGQYVLIGGRNGALFVYKSDSLVPVESMHFNKNTNMQCMVVKNDQLWCAFNDGSIYLLSFPKLQVVRATGLSFNDARSMAIRDDLLVCGAAGAVYVLNSSTLEIQFSFKGHGSYVYGVCVLDSGMVLSGGDDKRLMLWDSKDGKVQHQLTMESEVKNLAVSHDSSILAVGVYINSESFDSSLGVVTLYSLPGFEIMVSLSSSVRSMETWLCFSPFLPLFVFRDEDAQVLRVIGFE